MVQGLVSDLIEPAAFLQNTNSRAEEEEGVQREVRALSLVERDLLEKPGYMLNVSGLFHGGSSESAESVLVLGSEQNCENICAIRNFFTSKILLAATET